MAKYQSYLGSFEGAAATGAQAITGVGFTPKALLIWSCNFHPTSPGSFLDFNYWSHGFTDGTTQVAFTSIQFDGSATSDPNHSVVTDGVILAEATDGTVQRKASITSFDADGFTVNWSNVGDGDGRWYDFIAIGGDEVSCKVGTFNANTSTGAQAVTGVGFLPTGLHVSVAQNSGTSDDRLTYPAMGWTDGTNQGVSAVFSESGSAASNTKRYQRIDKCAALLDAATGAVLGEAGITSFDADGFTVNWSTAAASALRVYYLAFSGFPFKVGSLTQPASSSSVSTTGLDFQPGTVLLQSVNAAASTSVQDTYDFSIGAAMARHSAGVQTVTQRAMWLAETDAAADMEAARYYSHSQTWAAGVVNATGASSTLAASAVMASLDYDGFTLTHTADGTQRQIIFAAWSSEYSHRNLVSGQGHTVVGHDNAVSGKNNTCVGTKNHVHGENGTVIGHRSALFNMDGTTRTLEGDDKFEVYGTIGGDFSSGDIQTLLDGISTTQGTILYYNGTNWVALATGTSGQFLQTQGAAANPQWATPSGSGVNGGVFTFSFGDAAGFNPLDSTTYGIGYQAFFDPATTNNLPFVAPRDGEVVAVYARLAVLGTLGTSGQNSTFAVRNVTATTSETISSSVALDANPTRFNNAAMSLAFSAGDELDISWLTPAWTTNPTQVYGVVMMYVEFA